MIRSLAITNLAVIESVSVHFEQAFNVLTGETGAGKSMLVGAVGLLIGGRASADLVRTGAELATIEAVFEAADGRTVVVRREVSAQGRSRAFVDGQLTTSAALRPLVVAVHRAARTARAPAAARSPDPSSARRCLGRPRCRRRRPCATGGKRSRRRSGPSNGRRWTRASGRPGSSWSSSTWPNWARRSWSRVRTRSLAQTRDVLRHAEPADRAVPRILRPALRRRGRGAREARAGLEAGE